jgi:hypothetical protein
MVSRILRSLNAIVLAAAGLFAPAMAWGQQDEAVRIYPLSVMMGEPVTVTLRSEQVAQRMETLDWQTLERDFVIDRIDRESDRLRLRLYPLQSGVAEMAAHRLGDLQIPHTRIDVRPNPQVSVSWIRPPQQIYPGQSVAWHARVELQDAANLATMQVIPQSDWKSAAAEQPLYDKKRADGSQERLLGAHYEMIASSGGAVERQETLVVMRSPVVEIKHRGNRPWRFFDRTAHMQQRVLPSFLPAAQAVGEVHISSPPVAFWQTTGNLNYWEWELTAQGMASGQLPQMVYRLRAQLPYSSDIEWLTDSREVSESIGASGLESRITVRLPFRVLKAGGYQIPSLQWQYFDPHSGKLQTHQLPAHWGVALPGWVYGLIQWVLALIGIWVLAQFWRVWTRWRNRRQLRRELRLADGPKALYQALWDWHCRHPLGQRPLRCNERSGGQFLTWYRRVYGTQSEPTARIAQLDAQLYARPRKIEQDVAGLAEPWKQIQQAWLDWAKRLPLWGRREIEHRLNGKPWYLQLKVSLKGLMRR